MPPVRPRSPRAHFPLIPFFVHPSFLARPQTLILISPSLSGGLPNVPVQRVKATAPRSCPKEAVELVLKDDMPGLQRAPYRLQREQVTIRTTLHLLIGFMLTVLVLVLPGLSRGTRWALGMTGTRGGWRGPPP
jgi:hypothetical protein